MQKAVNKTSASDEIQEPNQSQRSARGECASENAGNNITRASDPRGLHRRPAPATENRGRLENIHAFFFCGIKTSAGAIKHVSLIHLAPFVGSTTERQHKDQHAMYPQQQPKIMRQ